MLVLLICWFALLVWSSRSSSWAWNCFSFQLDLHSISLTPGQVCVLNSTTESPGFCKILSSSHSLFWGPSLFVISAFWLPALWIPGWLNRFLPLGKALPYNNWMDRFLKNEKLFMLVLLLLLNSDMLHELKKQLFSSNVMKLGSWKPKWPPTFIHLFITVLGLAIEQ